METYLAHPFMYYLFNSLISLLTSLPLPSTSTSFSPSLPTSLADALHTASESSSIELRRAAADKERAEKESATFSAFAAQMRARLEETRDAAAQVLLKTLFARTKYRASSPFFFTLLLAHSPPPPPIPPSSHMIVSAFFTH